MAQATRTVVIPFGYVGPWTWSGFGFTPKACYALTVTAGLEALGACGPNPIDQLCYQRRVTVGVTIITPVPGRLIDSGFLLADLVSYDVDGISINVVASTYPPSSILIIRCED